MPAAVGRSVRAPDPQERVGDDLRDTVTAALSEHTALGRLTAAEHDERVRRALSARMHADLTPLLADLPALPQPALELRRQVVADRRRRRTAVLVVLAPWALVCSGLWVLWFVLGGGEPWPIWPTLGWGVPTVLGAGAALRGRGGAAVDDDPDGGGRILPGEQRPERGTVAV